MPDTVSFYVNHGDYMISNGFPIFDPLVKQIIVSTYGLIGFQVADKLSELTYVEPVIRECMPYYEPEPPVHGWSEGVIAVYDSKVEQKTEPGTCHVPYDLAKCLLLRATVPFAFSCVARHVNNCEHTLSAIEKEKRLGIFADTEEESIEKRKQYANSKSITEQYAPCFFTKQDEEGILRMMEKQCRLLYHIADAAKPFMKETDLQDMTEYANLILSKHHLESECIGSHSN